MAVYDKEETGKIVSVEFLTNFFKIGNDERARVHSEAIVACREAEKQMKEEQALTQY